MNAIPNANQSQAVIAPNVRAARPAGVTLIGVLLYVGGILAVLVGLLTMAMGAFLAPFLVLFLGPLAAYLFLAGAGLLALGVFYLALAPSTMRGKAWAWKGNLVALAIGAALNVVSLVTGDFSAVLGLLVAAAVVWYLFTPTVKTYFGQGHVATPWAK